MALGLGSDQCVEIAADLPGAVPGPVGGQQLSGQLRIAQLDAAEFMDQQRAHAEGLFRIQIACCLDGPRQGAETVDEMLVVGGDGVEVPAFAHQFLQRAAGQRAEAAALDHHYLVVRTGVLQDVQHRFAVGVGVRQHAGRDEAEALPLQFATQAVALRGGQDGAAVSACGFPT